MKAKNSTLSGLYRAYSLMSACGAKQSGSRVCACAWMGADRG